MKWYAKPNRAGKKGLIVHARSKQTAVSRATARRKEEKLGRTNSHFTGHGFTIQPVGE